jgi:hypothetical protein
MPTMLDDIVDLYGSDRTVRNAGRRPRTMAEQLDEERDYIVPRGQHMQDVVPSVKPDMDYLEEMLKWQRQDDLSRGYLSDTDKGKFTEALASGDYRDVASDLDLVSSRAFDDIRQGVMEMARRYGMTPEEAAREYVEYVNEQNSLTPTAIQELDPSTQQSFSSRLLWGDYDPEAELEEPMSSAEMAADIGWGLTPLWGLIYGHDIEKRWQRGYRPGLIEAGMLAAPFLARPVYKAGRGFVRGFKGRRDYEKALKANALPLPDPNRTVIEKGMFGRPRTTRRYVDPSMEFTPYEEVR